MRHHTPPSRRHPDGRSSRIRARRGSGFSLVEVLVAGSIGAVFMTAAALTYAAITANQNEMRSFGEVTVGSANLENFFGVGAPRDAFGQVVATRNLPWAPNYAKGAELEIIRDAFWEDVDQASAVFCLARTGRNTYRPTYIPLGLDVDARSIDTPEAFRQVVDTYAPGVFDSYRGAPAAASTNASVYILRPSEFTSFLAVLAIYDIDFVTTSDPPGTYVAIRRYQGSSVTLPYEIFYPAGEGTQSFGPLMVAFERRGRRVLSEGAADRFKQAANRPFYFLWWPDPVDKHLEPFPYGAAPTFNTTTDPRSAYREMCGRTAFFFVVPMFPSL